MRPDCRLAASQDLEADERGAVLEEPCPGDESESGFTLVELMVVLVIIGLLATVVIINVMPATDKAALTKAKADIATLEQGVEMFRLNNLQYPTPQQGLKAALAARSGSAAYSGPGRAEKGVRRASVGRRLGCR